MRRQWNAGVLIVPALFLLAFVARLLPVLRGAGLHGLLAYDDGVYFGAGEAFSFGRLPYRDFLMLHPPGIALVLLPFALLARLLDDDSTGFAVARLTFMGVGAVNAVLVYRVAKARLGGTAGVAGGLFYAVWQPAVMAERTTLLEPLVNLGILTSLLLLGDPRTTSRRRLVLAGGALGLASAVKLWAVVPLVVLLCWVALCRRRAALPYLAGAAGAAAAVSLPFFLAAPGSMVRLVLLDQLQRPASVPWQRRLAGVSLARYLGGFEPALVAWLAVPVVLALVAAAVAFRRSPAARPWCALFAAQLLVLLAAPTYYPRYAAYVAPALALVVASTTADGLGILRRYAPRSLPGAVVAGVVALLGLLAVSGLHTAGRPPPGPAARAALSGARCVAADTPATLLATDTLVRDLRQGCAVVIDPTGLVYDLHPSRSGSGYALPGRRADVQWQQRMQTWFAASDAVIVQRRNLTGLSADTLRELARGRTVSRYGSYDVYVDRSLAP